MLENKNKRIQEFADDVSSQNKFKYIVAQGRKINSSIKKAESHYNHERVR